jgi:hypothetical protein
MAIDSGLARFTPAQRSTSLAALYERLRAGGKDQFETTEAYRSRQRPLVEPRRFYAVTLPLTETPGCERHLVYSADARAWVLTLRGDLLTSTGGTVANWLAVSCIVPTRSSHAVTYGLLLPEYARPNWARQGYSPIGLVGLAMEAAEARRRQGNLIAVAIFSPSIDERFGLTWTDSSGRVYEMGFERMIFVDRLEIVLIDRTTGEVVSTNGNGLT